MEAEREREKKLERLEGGREAERSMLKREEREGAEHALIKVACILGHFLLGCLFFSSSCCCFSVESQILG